MIRHLRNEAFDLIELLAEITRFLRAQVHFLREVAVLCINQGLRRTVDPEHIKVDRKQGARAVSLAENFSLVARRHQCRIRQYLIEKQVLPMLEYRL